MAKRIAVRCTILLLVGAILTVSVAWASALLVSPDPAHDGLDPLQLAPLRREFFERAGPDPGGADPGTLFVTVAHVRPGVEFLDVAVEDEDIGADAFAGPLPYIGVTRAGWPVIAFEGQCHRDASRSPRPRPLEYQYAWAFKDWLVRGNRLFFPRMIPLRPRWPGVAIDLLFWTAAAAVAWYGPIMLVRLVRWRRGRCVACGYPIGTSPLCTECGRQVRPRGPSAAEGHGKMSS